MVKCTETMLAVYLFIIFISVVRIVCTFEERVVQTKLDVYLRFYSIPSSLLMYI